ncbi:MAG TPA: cupin domain-containing protein [Polyangiales bacterium]|nr:cupin domain-containing protein [Polyangiales bacterium]
MTKPQSPVGGTNFDLNAVEQELRHDDAFARNGHAARTLIHEPDLRIVLVAMKAGSRIREHRANETASIHPLHGHIRLQLENKAVELRAGQLLVLESGLPHDVEAIADGAFLLTLGWRKGQATSA